MKGEKIKRVASINVEKTSAIAVLKEVEKFNSFCDQEISAAIKELGGIKRSRVKLQKLVYVHLVDNFDQLIDRLLLWSSTHLSRAREEVLSQMSGTPISIKRIYELFLLGEKAKESIEREIIEKTLQEHIRNNHASKVSLLARYVSWDEVNKNMRITVSGRISGTALAGPSVQKNVPTSVKGFAHYLFARRNGISHGDSIRFNGKDRETITEQYKVKLPPSFRIKPATIETAVTFYRDFLKHYVAKLEKTVID